MSYLRYMCLFVYSGVQHILCCVFRRYVYPMLPVSLCFSPSCVPYVISKNLIFLLTEVIHVCLTMSCNVSHLGFPINKACR
jgi:hypothetical protein